MKFKFLLFVVCLVLFSLTNLSFGYKYLGILPTAAFSHYIVGSSLFKELARRGHEVTVISPFSLEKPMKNFRHISTPSIFAVMEEGTKNELDYKSHGVFEKLLAVYNLGISLSKAILDEPEVQKLLHSNETFDAVICEVFMTESLFGFSEHFKAPLIALNTYGATALRTDLTGAPSPPSYVPHIFLPFTESMTLMERIKNLFHLTIERGLLDFYHLPKQAALYKEYFSNAQRDLYEVRKNTALLLLNSHVSLGYARPNVPNQIEVGGMHIIRKTNPLPDHIKKFIEEAKDGVIYFSFGSNVKGKNLPLEKRQAILETSAKLKERVLWKFEEPNMEGKPDNVLISEWFPQNDILAHPNVKLLISHGGLLSVMEALYHSKPLIGIPIFGDQISYMKRAEVTGYGVALDLSKLSKETFSNAIEKILNDPKYKKVANDISLRYRDQPIKPLDLAVYWVEHIVKHKGAKYLHCAGQDLNFIQYHNLDAILILYGGLILLLILIIQFIRLILNLCFGKKQKASMKVKKN